MIVISFKNKVKKMTIVKKLKKNKWKKYSKREMFSKKELDYLNKNPDNKKFIIDKHIDKNKYVDSNIKNIARYMVKSSYLNKEEVEDMDNLVYDMLLWYFKYGFSLNEYLSYKFISKTYDERIQFASDRDSVIAGYDFNDIDDMQIFGDKMDTYNKFKDYFKREAISLSGKKDFNKFKKFVSKHKKIVKKEVRESCGNSVELIDIEKHKDISNLFDEIIKNGKVIIEELVYQGKDTAKFNESSVNTIRCITLNTGDDILFPYCFMKIGRQGKFIDNGGAGGILVGINSNTGILNTNGVDELGKRYEYHPDSKIKFKGQKLPKWEEMLSICENMALKIKSIKFIGWDLAYSKNDEWIVIEGNELTEFIGPQSTSQIGIRDEINSFYKLSRTSGGI